MKSSLLRLTASFVCGSLILPFTGSAQAAVPIPLNRPAPVALDKVRVQNPAVLPLTGTWKFAAINGELTETGFRRAGKKAATASSFQTGNPPISVLEKRGGGKWCASSEAMPQWWMVDLGGPQELNSLKIDWEFGDAIYNFKVEGSLNQTDWVTLADKSAGAKSGHVEITPTSTRWIRITITGAKRADSFTWACIRNVEIKVTENGKVVDWKPTPPAENIKERDAFTTTNFDDKSWSNIPVPANWEVEGFSKPTYDQPDDAVGLYRRWVNVPATFKDKKVLWHFDGVFAGAEIFVNGQPIAIHDSGFTAFDVDVTKVLKPGQRNLLAVRVSKTTPSVDLDTGDYWSLGGIYRENYLLALPQTHVSDIAVTTDLDDKYHDATLNAALKVSGKAGTTVSVTATLIDKAGKRVPNLELRGTGKVGTNGIAALNLRSTVKAPLLWSAEKPNLYYLAFTLKSNNQTIEQVQERFGFREIEIRNSVVLWNGVPIKCTGVNHHEEWADKGHALTEENWRRDLTLMKSFNINAIRTSHYNPASRFLELCDEMGFYVLDEVPFCWANPNDPKLKEPFVNRAKETLARDKNHPSIMAWSLGNESGYGPASEAAFDYVKATDPTRPALVSMCGYWNNPKLDFADFHYPSLSDMERISTEKKAPAIFTEQPHILYGWHALQYDPGAKDIFGKILARNWDFIWNQDHMVGSFVWEWQDQGLADKFADKENVSPATGLRSDNNKGLVDSYRKPKPETWHLKMVYSPVTITTREIAATGNAYKVKVLNRYSFTNLSELTVRWKALDGFKTLAEGQSKLNGAPRTEATASFPVTEGATDLRLEFFHADGRSVYTTKLHVTGTPLPQEPEATKAGNLSLVDGATDIQIESASTKIVVDKMNGQIRSWKSGQHDMIVRGPVLNLGENRYTWGEHGAKNFLYSKEAPQLKNVRVEAKQDEKQIVLTVTGDVFMVESPESKGKLTYNITVSPNAEAIFNWKLDWTAPEINLWEAGLKFKVADDLVKLDWQRNGQWTEYPSGHFAANIGTVFSGDISYRSTKRDVQWANLSPKVGAFRGGKITALQVEGPLHLRARDENKENWLFLSSQVPPPVDFSTNLIPEMLLNLKTGESVSGSFRLRVSD